MLEIENNLGIDPILKWEILRKCHEYKAYDKYYYICMEEKPAIATYNNPNELLNQKS